MAHWPCVVKATAFLSFFINSRAKLVYRRSGIQAVLIWLVCDWDIKLTYPIAGLVGNVSAPIVIVESKNPLYDGNTPGNVGFIVPFEWRNALL